MIKTSNLSIKETEFYSFLVILKINKYKCIFQSLVTDSNNACVVGGCTWRSAASPTTLRRRRPSRSSWPSLRRHRPRPRSREGSSNREEDFILHRQKAIQSGASGCEKGFVKCFLKVSLACLGSTAAAVQSNGLRNSQKTFLQNM